MITALRRHWPEYLMEAAGLGMFMVSASFFVILLEYPASPAHGFIVNADVRRFLVGAAMGLTAVAIIYSPWGKRSGAHINPAVTLAFLRLGKIAPADGFFYVAAQFIGGAMGVYLSAEVAGMAMAHPAVNYVATLPGPRGTAVAFIAEALISFGLMGMVLIVSNRKNLARYTGIFAGILVAAYITVEAPLSGMSMNPARSFASAFPGRIWTAFWIYMAAPPLGMLAAAEIYLRIKGLKEVYCAKLHHFNNKRCIFNCRFGEMIAKD